MTTLHRRSRWRQGGSLDKQQKEASSSSSALPHKFFHRFVRFAVHYFWTERREDIDAEQQWCACEELPRPSLAFSDLP